MKQNRAIIIIIFLTLIASIVLSFYSYYSYATLTNKFIFNVIETLDEEYENVDIEKIVNLINTTDHSNSEVLTSYGFSDNDISILSSLEREFIRQIIINVTVVVLLISMCLIIIYIKRKKYKKDLNNIVAYLKELNQGNYDLKIDLNSEGILSVLENEIYTTTVMLREKAESELQDKVNLKDSLTNISHQIKTPLTSISLLVDNLLEDNMDKKTRKEFLQDIKMQIENTNELIVILLKLSRFDANVVTFKKENINVKNLLLDILKHIDILREVKNVDIHISGNSEVSFIGDYKWEFEALSNILKNCLEHTLENKNIYIEYSSNNSYTQIIIKDEGKGMSSEEKKRIFERFYKGKESGSNNFGVGMSLAKEIITKDNGKIKVYSEINKGTTFKIRYYK